MTVQLYENFILILFFKAVMANYLNERSVLAAPPNYLDNLSWLLHKASQYFE
jgi:hypothetical protein